MKGYKLMKNNLLVLISLVLSIFMLSGTIAFADYEITKCSVDQSGNLTLEGKASQSGERVAIEIVKPTFTISDIENITSDGILNIFGNILELTAGEDAVFKTSFKLGGTSGYYDIRLKGEHASEPTVYSDAFLYLSDEDRAALLSDLNIASDGASMKLAIENACFYDYLDINYPAYDNYSSAQKDTLALFALSSRKNGFASAKDASVCISYGISSVNLSISSDAENVFASDAGYIGFAEGDTAFGFYSEILDDAARKSVVSALKENSPYTNIDSYIATLYDNIILRAISESDNHAQVEPILLGFEDYLGDKLSKYKACTVKTDVNKKIVGKSFGAVKSLFEQIDAYITDLTTPPEEKDDDVIISTDNRVPMPSGPKPSSPSPAPSAPVGSSPSAPPSIKPLPTTVFGDLDGFDWAEESINTLYNNGVISGKDNGIFAPADTVTRAEFVKMIVLALFESDSSANSDFADVDKNSWSYPYISTAYKMGLVQGNTNGFGASDNITRQDMAVIINRCMEKKNLIPASKDSVAFDDDNLISDYAKDAVALMKSEGIINGKGNNMFAPLDNLTRAEAAVIIIRVINMQ